MSPEDFASDIIEDGGDMVIRPKSDANNITERQSQNDWQSIPNVGQNVGNGSERRLADTGGLVQAIGPEARIVLHGK